jgi:3-hydroxyacyl-CoA dehydrogenase / enoyl-CoA hydratase / 3-hydroxybutyryl-CoA epimerase / enoyl-CoA isomerase
MYSGYTIQVFELSDAVAELRFDREKDAINKFDLRTVQELSAATAAIRDNSSVKGVLVTSGKDAFIVGADIFEFGGVFAKSVEAIAAFNATQAAVFTAFEDLPVPIVTSINGLALGGGFEMALASDYRLMASNARVGLPEITLGLFPGYGGSVRLPRLIGAAPALEWITSGKAHDADAALAVGAVDWVGPAAQLRQTALGQLNSLIASGHWRKRRASRSGAIELFDAAAVAAIKNRAAKIADHNPAALAVCELVESSADRSRDAAMVLEASAFARIAKTPVAAALIQLFINDQLLKRKTKGFARVARKVNRAAIIGAGIMGGGIAYTSAVGGIPVLMKDIAQAALNLGMGEAEKLLAKRVESGRAKPGEAAIIRASISPVLEYTDFAMVDAVVEAVVENIDVKKAVLAEVESNVRPDTVIASNTSSLSITAMASGLRRPENFAGMHFFNPVPVMPLVEVIRGDKTSEATVAAVAGYAIAMGKTPIIVKDCPGFLVNRILTPYIVGFLQLLRDGADFEEVDRVMEAFGWPMGPAYLQDVIGMDTSSHVFDTIAFGYPERMWPDFKDAVHLMAEARRFGQKSGSGFYRYESNAKGRPIRMHDDEAHSLITSIQQHDDRTFCDQEIVDRVMLPMILEAALCLEEGVADSAAEIDTGIILGLGFPRHLGGPLKYADLLGLDKLVSKCDEYSALGNAYHVSASLRAAAQAGQQFHRST